MNTERTHGENRRNLVLTAGFLIAAIITNFIFDYLKLQEVNVLMVYVLAVVLTARYTSRFTYTFGAVFVAIVAFNCFYLPPKNRFAVFSPYYAITLILIVVITMVVCTITVKANEEAVKAKDREKITTALFDITNKLTDAHSIREIMDVSLECICDVLHASCGFILLKDNGDVEKDYVFKAEGKPIEVQKTIYARNITTDDEKKPGGYYVGNRFYEWQVKGQEEVYGYILVPIDEADCFTPMKIKMLKTIAEAVGMVFDRYYIQEKEQQIAQENAQERFRSSLLRSISHDLRTPLAGIIGTSELIQTLSGPDTEISSLAANITKESRWLNNMVQNILAMTRLQDGSVKIHKELFVLEDLIQSSIEGMQIRYPQREFLFEAPTDVITAQVESKLIMQVLFNLMDNAVKHSPADEPIELALLEDEANKQVRITVKDRGTGLTPEQKENIFHPFYTTRGNEKEGRKGVGLGLAICESIVKAHNGSIRAENNTDGAGATFIVELPQE